MASRLARTVLATSSRAALRPKSHLNVARRHMSESAHTGPGPAAKSDTPWIIGSVVVFAPMLAYLLSPAAKKSGSHDSHDKHESHAPVTMKDDEGTEENVTGSLEQAETEDAPKAAQDATSDDATPPAQGDATPPAHDEPQGSTDVSKHMPEENKAAATSTSDKRSEGPTDQGDARDAALKKEDPKEQDAHKD